MHPGRHHHASACARLLGGGRDYDLDLEPPPSSLMDTSLVLWDSACDIRIFNNSIDNFLNASAPVTEQAYLQIAAHSCNALG